MAEQQMVDSKNSKSHNTIIFLIIIIVLLALVVAGYLYLNNKANQQNNKNQATITKLEAEIKTLKDQISNQGISEDTSSGSSNTTTVAIPSANTIANITDAIKSGNTAALEGYMASTVLVIIAASEGIGNRTPGQAVSDLNYLNNATSPWNFNLDATTLTRYANGDYKTYFKANTLVGRSANNYVVAFNFDSAGKINGIFMAVNDSLL